MKFSIVLAAAATTVLAQDLSTLPTCAVECLTQAIGQSGCKPTDVACQCGEKKQIIAEKATPCLLQKCTSADDLGKAAAAGAALCLNVPNSPVASSSAPSSPVATPPPAVSTGSPKSNGTSVPTGPSTTSGTAPGSANTPVRTGAAVTLGASALLGLVGAMVAL